MKATGAAVGITMYNSLLLALLLLGAWVCGVGLAVVDLEGVLLVDNKLFIVMETDVIFDVEAICDVRTVLVVMQLAVLEDDELFMAMAVEGIE